MIVVRRRIKNMFMLQMQNIRIDSTQVVKSRILMIEKVLDRNFRSIKGRRKIEDFTRKRKKDINSLQRSILIKIKYQMKSQTIFVLCAFALFLSCFRAQMLQKNQEPMTGYKVNCKNWDESTGTCLECFEGCTKWENICVKVVKHCAKWDKEGNCTDCQKGYGDEQNKSVNGSCPKQQTSNATQTNATVGQGNIMPQIISTIDVNCQCHTEQRVCIDCFSGYYLDVNATCQEVPENCTAANSKGQCTGCVQGFTVEEGQCVEKICDKSLCVTFNADQTQCIKCPQRSYLESGCCYEVNGYCSEWIESTGECTACYQGYEINKDNKWQCIASSS